MAWPSVLPWAVFSWVCSGGNEGHHLKIQGHGSQPENNGLPTSGREWVASPSGGDQESMGLVHEWEVGEVGQRMRSGHYTGLWWRESWAWGQSFRFTSQSMFQPSPMVMSFGLETERMSSQIQIADVAKMSFLCRVSGLTPRDRVWSRADAPPRWMEPVRASSQDASWTPCSGGVAEKDVWAAYLACCHYDSVPDKCKRMDGWINVALGSKRVLSKTLNPKLLNGSVNLPIKKKNESLFLKTNHNEWSTYILKLL